MMLLLLLLALRVASLVTVAVVARGAVAAVDHVAVVPIGVVPTAVAIVLTLALAWRLRNLRIKINTALKRGPQETAKMFPQRPHIRLS
jgi:hypothetical protein